MGASVKKKNTRYYIHVVIYLLISFGVGFLPPFGQITEYGMRGLGLFLGTLYGWIFLDMLWPSLLVMVFIPLLGHQTITTVVLNSFGANLTVQVFLLLTLAAYFEKKGLIAYLANWFVSREIAIGKPWVLLSLIMICSFLLSAFSFVLASIVIMWGITYHIAETVKAPQYDRYIEITLIGIVIAATFGIIAMPFQIIAATIIDLITTSGGSVNIAIYIAFMLIISFVGSASYIIICKFVLRPDTHLIEQADDIFADLRHQKMDNAQKESSIILIILLLVLLLPAILPHEGGILKILSDYGLTGCVMLLLGSIAIPRDPQNGTACTSLSDCIRSGVSWELYILLAATTPMVNLLESADAGILVTITDFLVPLFADLSPWFALGLTVFICCILSQLFHNIVVIMVMTPLLLPLLTEIGVSPVAVGMGIGLASVNALMTPAASAQSALCFGNPKWIKRSDCYLLTSIAVFSGIIVLLISIPIMMTF